MKLTVKCARGFDNMVSYVAIKVSDYNKWLAQVPGNCRNAYALCRKKFAVLSMGESALKSHAKGAKHKQLLEIHVAATESGSTLKAFFGCSTCHQADNSLGKLADKLL